MRTLLFMPESGGKETVTVLQNQSNMQSIMQNNEFETSDRLIRGCWGDEV